MSGTTCWELIVPGMAICSCSIIGPGRTRYATWEDNIYSLLKGLLLYRSGSSACCTPILLWQEKLRYHCLNSGLYSVFSGQPPQAPGETLALSPRLISPSSAMPTLEAAPPSREDAKCSDTSGYDPTPAVQIPLQGPRSLGDTHWFWKTFKIRHNKEHTAEASTWCCAASPPNCLTVCMHSPITN